MDVAVVDLGQVRGLALYRAIREGGSHTIFRSRTGALIPVPRHAEIGESLARKIVRDARR